MAHDSDLGGEAPCWAHFVDELERDSPAVRFSRSNTILYCDAWPDVVTFYRTALGLPVTAERSWFIEFELHTGSFLSVADAAHTSVVAGDGSGLTLSWQVDDIEVAHRSLLARGLVPSPIAPKWGASTFFVFDPADNRIEIWADS